ncbi:MAG: TM2 domain-containing protein, partial [Clostridia bacterium]|nr:TM2 domain-containing protein [Clostridia bacterium]
MFCRNCGQEMNDNQAICLGCGVKVGEGNAFCQNCGKPVDAAAEVCLNCGVAIKKAGSDLAGKDKIVIILLLVFLGGIGIHNFVMGETKKGIAKILLSIPGSLLCGIGP